MIFFKCPECEEAMVFYPGFVTNRFAYDPSLNCLICGAETQFDKRECLEYTLYMERN